MAEVVASVSQANTSPTSDFVLSPSSQPSWHNAHRNLIHTRPSLTGFTTSWVCDGATRLAITTTHRPSARCIAYFPPLTTLSPADDPPTSASLVVANFRFVTIATPGSELVRIPLGDPLTDPNSVDSLFALPRGLILRTQHPPHYYHLAHPLQSPVPVHIPDSHELVHAFVDVPLLITRSAASLTIWSTSLVETQIPDTPDQLSQPIIASTTLSLSECRVLPIHPNLKVSAFLSHDARGLLVLCIVCDGVLTGLSVQKVKDTITVDPSFRIRDATSAVPVIALRRHHRSLDALIQHPDGTLSLFMGHNRLCTVVLPRSADPPLDCTLAQPVAEEFSVLGPDGHGVRFSLRDAGFVSPLVPACLAALCFAFERAGAIRRINAIYHDVLAARAQVNASSMSSTRAFVDSDREWHIFEQVLVRAAVPPSTDDPMDTDTPLQEPLPESQNWQALLRSEFHETHALGGLLFKTSEFLSGADRPAERALEPGSHVPDTDLLRQILHALHMLYEDRKLSSVSHHESIRLARLNLRLAMAMGNLSYISHYSRDFPELLSVVDSELPLSEGTTSQAPSLIDFLAAKVLRTPSRAGVYPTVSFDDKLTLSQPAAWTASWRSRIPFHTTHCIISYYDIMFAGSRTESKGDIDAWCTKLLLRMVSDGFTQTDLDALPFGVALPLRDGLWKCRQNPQPDWPYAAFALIGREDLFNFVEFDADPRLVGRESLSLVGESRALLRIQAAAAESAHSTATSTSELDAHQSKDSSHEKDKLFLDDKGDGCDMQGAVFRLRFREDKRIDEVRRVLRSTDFIIMTPVQVQGNENNVEFDMVTEQKRKLELLLRKRMAAPVGRGAFTLRTFILSDPTTPLAVPRICMSGKVFAQGGTKVTCTPTDPSRFQWGEFHNGVAAGLRIVAADSDMDSETGQILTRSWIVNHRPSDTSGSSTHAGMLLALGLGGYLPALRKTDYYQYLVPRHELTAIGLMLGVSTGNIGSMDEKITKMLCLHIRPFNEAGFAVPDFHISVNVQTAAVLGLGFLHQGSCENSLLEGLFSELGRRPKPGDLVDDREGLSLAAGIAIGLICLGLGNSAFDAADRRRIDRLLLFANGGAMNNFADSNGHHDTLSRTEVIAGQERPTAALAESETSRVKEGRFVNTDVMSPGAILALALIYLKTNDKRLADRLHIPDTLYGLDRSRPDHVYLRLIARSLIMWDTIEASSDWIRSNLPQLLIPVNEQNDPLDLLGKVNISESYYEYEIDLDGILHARAFSVAGLCTAIALKYAGTNDRRAVELLMQECKAFEEALKNVTQPNESRDWVYTTGLCAAALGLSVVAAGSGDLEILRLLRRLRKRKGMSEDLSRYGIHMAMHTAIGFVFLGGGCQTFGTSNIGLVGLLCAIHPQFPRDVNDNQYHLQALRHLYVLAVEPRCIETRDVDTGESCSVDVDIGLRDGSMRRTQTPCIVPEAGTVEEIGVVGERYLGRKVRINPAASGRGWFSGSQRQVIFVKRKTGHLPYTADPRGAKGIVARSVTRPRPGSEQESGYAREIAYLVRAFSADPDILALVEYFCSEKGRQRTEENERSGGVGVEGRLVEMVYECLAQDKRSGVKVHLEARRAAEAARNGDLGLAGSASMVVGEAYLQRGAEGVTSLVRPGFLAAVIEQVWAAVSRTTVHAALLRYVLSGGTVWPRGDERTCHDLAVVLRLTGIGSACAVADLRAAVHRAVEVGGDAVWAELSSKNVPGLRERGMEVVAKAVMEGAAPLQQ